MQDYSDLAIESASRAQVTFCKFITANDVNATGAHQSGYYIHKNAYEIAFDQPGIRGNNMDRIIKILWQRSFETESRFIYYGTATRNEYRLTRFGRDNPFVNEQFTGSLLVLNKIQSDYYEAYVLDTDESMSTFMSYFNLSPLQLPGIIDTENESWAQDIDEYSILVKGFSEDFPPTIALAEAARDMYSRHNKELSAQVITNPDQIITEWIDTEFKLFKALENDRYNELLKNPFKSVEELVQTSNTILNRRKSRAGKSLEHHLAALFDANFVRYSAQKKTEGDKRPDFIFPGIEEYRNSSFERNRLTFLGAKTTCKDRWRQVLNEANEIPSKHLFTLQQGVSGAQLQEMKDHNLTLVVPEQYISTFPAAHRDDLLSLKSFIRGVKSLDETVA